MRQGGDHGASCHVELWYVRNLSQTLCKEFQFTPSRFPSPVSFPSFMHRSTPQQMTAPESSTIVYPFRHCTAGTSEDRAVVYVTRSSSTLTRDFHPCRVLAEKGRGEPRRWRRDLSSCPGWCMLCTERAI